MNWHLWFALILAIAGIGLLVLAMTEAVPTPTATSWSSTKAIVTESRVEREYDDGIFYRFTVAYRYEVDSKAYVGTRVRANDGIVWGWSWPARLKAKKYSVGSSVVAHYPKTEPGNAILEPGVNVSRILGLSGAALVLLGNAWNQLNS